MNKQELADKALDYHSRGRHGKIEVIATKPCATQQDLSLAYTPGVAAPCMAINKNNEDAYKYTAKGNLVAVVTNGTAVLGLGNIGALAGKPVMEGKGILFKRFADIDVFDIELNASTVEEIINTCKALEPTFGGINLEDIKAPECFAVEEELKKTLNIPVFHDDQHGTAIIGGAALMNALSVVGKKIEKANVVINGAGASGLAIANLIVKLGVKNENLIVCDTKGVIYKGRKEGMNPYKEKFARDTKARTLSDAVKNCDVLFGLSSKGAFSDDMIKSLAPDPIIFAMANPDPEITPEEVRKIRKDGIVATGRSDYPNQVNNVLCFPFIFRGALDVRAKTINEEMKVAAAHALANLAREHVPASVLRAYKIDKLEFGRDYIIPKPFDERASTRVSIAVAKAAMASGVAKNPIKDFDEYEANLEARLNPAKRIANKLIKEASKSKKSKIGFTFADRPNILQAAQYAVEKNVCSPVLIGDKEKIAKSAKTLGIDISKMEVIDPASSKLTESFAKEYHKMFWREGISETHAYNEVSGCNTVFSAFLLNNSELDGVVACAPNSLEETTGIFETIVKKEDDHDYISQAVILSNKDNDFLISDPRLRRCGCPEALSEMIYQTVTTADKLGFDVRCALITNSNFGSIKTEESENIALALDAVKSKLKKVKIDGAFRFFTATNQESGEMYPLASIKGDANTFVFPNGAAACATIGALRNFGGFNVCARIIQGFEKPLQVIDVDTDSDQILVSAAFAVLSAKKANKK